MSATTTASASGVSSSSTSGSYDALVLGAGWSGILTALRLTENHQKVLLLEARERVGGRAFTHTYDNNSKGSGDRTVKGKKSWGVEAQRDGVQAVDFGCSWIHGYYEGNPVKGICEKLNIPVSIPTPKKATIVGPSGALPEDLVQKITSNLSNAMSSAQALARSWSSGSTPASASLASYLLAHDSPLFSGLTDEQRPLAEGYARQMHIPLGTTLEHVALRWAGFEQNFSGTDAAPEGGFTRVIDALVEQFVQQGGKLASSEEVKKIQSQKEEGIKVVTASGTYEAPVAVCTFPLAVLKQQEANLFDPPLSEKKREVIQRTNVGDLNKVMLVYESAWWPKDVGTFTILPSSGSSSTAQGSADLPALLAKTTLMVGADTEHSRLLVMIGASAGRDLESFTRPQVADALHAYLAERIPVAGKGETGVQSPSHNFMTRWSKHALTGGATTTPVVVGEENSPLDFVELSKPEYSSHLLFAGEHTDLHHRGSVAGAVVSAEREAARALAFLEKRKVNQKHGGGGGGGVKERRKEEVVSDDAAAKM
ncbi:FAD/NAD(P)-binding domain-containing protein [Microstroma glucosiphilum]|uniref:FAD/NAD(P)-binding domain-containing protein n=1 Tax=Pseudomicrostroma glucosiphilum TaxID=1684307 RepID=A0A316U7Y9_9BASI|nr:FAD/NAD(P)-binding domain-containing protein [Pseudomicrostroma glucosiphilum]PWN20964.1 FAD/NAD(P)-binding domain-containing protein [Pseudomicrostroma glucosiphilum]